jgi:GNAT superfamily N-acetyltransferase
LAEIDIRPYEPGDTEEAVALIASGFPKPNALGPTTLRHWLEGSPERAQTRAWVARDGDELVGWGDAQVRWSLAEEGITEAWVIVRPDRRGRGLGLRLANLAEEHVGRVCGREIRTFVLEDDPASLTFAEARGFRESRREYSWVLFLDKVALDPPELPEGFRVVRLAEVRDRERALFELYDAAHADMPSDHAHALEFEEWRSETFQNPELDFEASSVVVTGDRPVAFAWIASEREKGAASHELTGTLPEFRGRGLARAAKMATIRWAAESGLRHLVTSNDSTNAPMLALNERLGYEPRTTMIELVKRLDRG